MKEINDNMDLSAKSFIPNVDREPKYDELEAIKNGKIPDCSPNGGCELINSLLDVSDDQVDKSVALDIIDQVYETNIKIRTVRQVIIKNEKEYNDKLEENNEKIRKLINDRNSLVYNLKLNLENDNQVCGDSMK